MALNATPTVTTKTPSGSEAEHALGGTIDLSYWAVQADGADMELAFASSGAHMTIKDGVWYSFSGRSWNGQSIFIDGASGTARIVEIPFMS